MTEFVELQDNSCYPSPTCLSFFLKIIIFIREILFINIYIYSCIYMYKIYVIIVYVPVLSLDWQAFEPQCLSTLLSILASLEYGLPLFVIVPIPIPLSLSIPIQSLPYPHSSLLPFHLYPIPTLSLFPFFLPSLSNPSPIPLHNSHSNLFPLHPCIDVLHLWKVFACTICSLYFDIWPNK